MVEMEDLETAIGVTVKRIEEIDLGKSGIALETLALRLCSR